MSRRILWSASTLFLLVGVVTTARSAPPRLAAPPSLAAPRGPAVAPVNAMGSQDAAPSCHPTPLFCGANRESCCTSLPVPGGTFSAKVAGKGGAVSTTVADFRLDKFEVTRGRFKRFVMAWDAGFRPSAGAGKHTQMNKGQGAKTRGKLETGWDPTWNDTLPHTPGDWAKAVDSVDHPWVSAPPAKDDQFPADSVNWAGAYAFCIWDGGFLPTEAEWLYAAGGGKEGRFYPWSVPPGANDSDCAHAFSNACMVPNQKVISAVGSLPAGNGKWGQSDLSGNQSEWVLDKLYQLPSKNCGDCEVAPDNLFGLAYGGSWNDIAYKEGAKVVSGFSAKAYSTKPPAESDGSIGFRCARLP
jgi:formylglycine-generating enzyme required for sulfatase activity